MKFPCKMILSTNRRSVSLDHSFEASVSPSLLLCTTFIPTASSNKITQSHNMQTSFLISLVLSLAFAINAQTDVVLKACAYEAPGGYFYDLSGLRDSLHSKRSRSVTEC